MSYGDQIRTSSYYDDLINGMELVVTLSLDTPLEFINLHGKIFTRKDTFEIPNNYGCWVAYLEGPSANSTRATHFGSMKEERVDNILIPFLKEYRGIVEGGEEPSTVFGRLKSLGKKHNIWRKHIKIKKAGTYKHLGEFWAVNNLSSIKGVGPVKAYKLMTQGIYTEHQMGD